MLSQPLRHQAPGKKSRSEIGLLLGFAPKAISCKFTDGLHELEDEKSKDKIDYG